MPRTRVVIQSRLNSSRLPGKALMSVGGMPLIELVARRASRSGHEVVVATSEEHYDTRIADHLGGVGIPVMRGSLDDVLGRFVEATKDLEPGDWVVRLTGDNPVGDALLIDELAEAMRAGGYTYGRNDISHMPEGLGCEIFLVDDLRRAHETSLEAYDHEHVTPWLRRNVRTLDYTPRRSPGDPLRFRCTVDVLGDFDRVARLFTDIGDPVAVPWPDLIHKLDAMIASSGATVPSRNHRGTPHSVLTLGGTQLSGPFASAPPEVREMLARAVDHGVTHVEVGRADGNAEHILRSCGEPQLTQRLKFISRLQPLVAGDASVARLGVEASLERSFAELGRRQVAAALLSGVEQVGLGGGAAWQRLQDYRSTGEVGAVGVSLAHASEASSLLGLAGLDFIELPFNVLAGQLPDAAIELTERGVTLLAHSIYAGGSLLRGDHPRAASLGEAVRATGRDGVADLAVSYVLGHPAVGSVAVGALTDDHMRHNLQLAAREPLTADQVTQVQQILR
ncbi:aldo/keto reductase [Calidifontibacter terrae]